MAGQVYFGNGTKQMWIPAPLTGMQAGSVGWAAETQKLNGRASVRRSKASHRVFSATWVGSLNDSNLENSLQTIRDYYDGYYGTGSLYWLDPYAMKTNILPPQWAAPMLTENDWVNIDSSVTPTFTAVTLDNDFPIKYATYSITGAHTSTTKLTIIIPPDYTFHFGWHRPDVVGAATTGVRIVPYLRADGTPASAVNPTALVAGGEIRTNTTVKGDTYSKVEIFLATSGTASLHIAGMIGQILPDGTSPARGPFFQGRGTTKLEFNQAPTVEYYSANINNGQIGMSATLIEVD